MAKRKNVLPTNNVLACFTVKHLPFGQAFRFKIHPKKRNFYCLYFRNGTFPVVKSGQVRFSNLNLEHIIKSKQSEKVTLASRNTLNTSLVVMITFYCTVHKPLGVTVLPMSAVSDEGVMTVKMEACDQLLAQRVEIKMKGRKAKDVMNRLHVAMPMQRDQKDRPPCIPQVKSAAGPSLVV